MNADWIEMVLARAKPEADRQEMKEHAMAIFAAVEGASSLPAAAGTSQSTTGRSGPIAGRG